MAKLAVTLTVVCLFFAFTDARVVSDLPENDLISHDHTATLPEPESKSILLPSERIDSEATAVTEVEPDTTDSKSPESNTVVATQSIEVSTVPLTVMSFRPINRHFPRRPLFPLGRRHRCHHHNQFKRWNPRLNGREIPLGNDMILSVDREKSADPMYPGGVRQIPAWGPRFHHGEPRFFPLGRREEMKRPHHHHHHHHHDEDEREEHEEHHKGGFMSKFRRFLHHF